MAYTTADSRWSCPLSLETSPFPRPTPTRSFSDSLCHRHLSGSLGDWSEQTESTTSGSFGSSDLLKQEQQDQHHNNSCRLDMKSPTIARGEDLCEANSCLWNIDACLPVRNICITGLVLAFCFALTAIVLGAYLLYLGPQQPPSFLQGKVAWVGSMEGDWYDRGPNPDWYFPGHWAFSSSQSASVIFPFMSSYVITALLDCTSLIHTTSLRWALYREERLRFHSNPRLFSASRDHRPNKWYVNTMGSLVIIFAYGTQSMLFAPIHILGYSNADDTQIEEPYFGPRYGIDIHGWALTVLGLSMLLQAFLAAWSLSSSKRFVKTWSTHIMATVRIDSIDSIRASEATLAVGPSREISASKASTGGSSSQRTSAKSHHYVKPKQESAREVVPSVRRITICLWVLFAASAACTVVVSILARYLPVIGDSLSRSYLETYGDGGTSLQGYWGTFGQVYFMLVASTSIRKGRDWLSVIVQSCFQAPLALGLHYTELLTDVLSDESEWREAMASSSSNDHPATVFQKCLRGLRKCLPEWLVEHLPRWRSVVLFMFKGFTQWIFSCTLWVQFYVMISLLPLVTLTVLLLVLATVAEVLARHHPRGEGRSTYGNLERCRAMLRA